MSPAPSTMHLRQRIQSIAGNPEWTSPPPWVTKIIERLAHQLVRIEGARVADHNCHTHGNEIS